MRARNVRAVAFLLSLLAFAGCFSNRTLFNTLNAPPDPNRKAPDPPPWSARASRLVENRAVDSYYHPDATIAQLERLWKAETDDGPRPLGRLYGCLWEQVEGPSPNNGRDCYADFFTAVFPVLSGEEFALKDPNARAIDEERDLIRLASNLASSGQDLVYLADEARCVHADCDMNADPLKSQLSPGIVGGLEQAAARLAKRSWHRRHGHYATAIVMSGGAADGAFIAGFVWSLLGAYQNAPGEPPIDLLVGTSTGALVGSVLDAYFSVNATAEEKGAVRQFLFTGYTTFHEKDLLCIGPGLGAYGMFLGNTQGLVRFDPLEDQLRKNLVTPASIANQTEFVTMSVDLTQGALWADSDQDPRTPSPAERIQSILASVVEPALAYPVSLPRPPDPQAMNIDGGVRSGLPLLEAARRGAERVLAFSASSLDPPPTAPRKNGGEILFRSIDLFVDQSRISEAHQAEDFALVRRTAERQVCQERYGNGAGDPELTRKMAAVCGTYAEENVKSGMRPMRRSVTGTGATFTRGRPTADIGEAWKSNWIFRPQTAGKSAVNYAFVPSQMRYLFEAGVNDFAHRCGETLTTLGFRNPGAGCTDERLGALVADMKKQFDTTPVSDVAPRIPSCQTR